MMGVGGAGGGGGSVRGGGGWKWGCGGCSGNNFFR